MKVELLLFVVVFALPTNGFCLNQEKTRKEARSQQMTAEEFFVSRPQWSGLPPSFLNALASRFKTGHRARQFAELAERGKIFRERVLPLAERHKGKPEVAVTLLASVLTSHAGGQINQKQYKDAKVSLELALLLEPDFWPAWCRLALVALVQEDCRTAISWADKFLQSKHAYASPEDEQEAAEALQEPSLVGMAQKMRQAMVWVKDMCKGQPSKR